MFLDEEGFQGLAQFLMTGVRAAAGHWQEPASGGEPEEPAGLEQQLWEQQQTQERCQQMQEDWETACASRMTTM